MKHSPLFFRLRSDVLFRTIGVVAALIACLMTATAKTATFFAAKNNDPMRSIAMRRTHYQRPKNSGSRARRQPRNLLCSSIGGYVGIDNFQ